MLNANFTKSVLTFYHEMNTNGISLVYMGEFNQEITKMFTSMADDDLSRKHEEIAIKKKVYHVMVETLQNMNKHADDMAAEHRLGQGLFIIGKKGETYYVITSNRILNSKVKHLQDMIERINASTKEELRSMYLKQIKEGKLSDKGGAGLGLIDIARKTGEKYEYQFLPINEKYCFFILKVEVKARTGEQKKEKELAHKSTTAPTVASTAVNNQSSEE